MNEIEWRQSAAKARLEKHIKDHDQPKWMDMLLGRSSAYNSVQASKAQLAAMNISAGI